MKVTTAILLAKALISAIIEAETDSANKRAALKALRDQCELALMTLDTE